MDCREGAEGEEGRGGGLLPAIKHLLHVREPTVIYRSLFKSSPLSGKAWVRRLPPMVGTL